MRFTLFGEHFAVGEVLGKGAYGCVHVARSDARLVAVKQVAMEDDDLRVVFEREKRLLERVSHQARVCRLIGSLQSQGSGLLVLELASGNLVEQLPRLDRTVAGAHMVAALSALHECGVSHRDLRLENFLLVGETVKIGDLGLASDESLMRTLEVQTWWYRAPEIFLGMQPYTSAADLWALGMLLMHLLHGHPPCEHREDKMLAHIFQDRRVPVATSFQQLSQYLPAPCAREPPLKRWSDQLAQLNPLYRTPLCHLMSCDADVRRCTLMSALLVSDSEGPRAAPEASARAGAPSRRPSIRKANEWQRARRRRSTTPWGVPSAALGAALGAPVGAQGATTTLAVPPHA